MNFHKYAIVRQIAGWTLIAIGIVGLILPVMPGWPFLGAGALLLAPNIRLFHRFAAWIHMRFPALRAHLRRFRHFPPKADSSGKAAERDPPRVDKTPKPPSHCLP